MNWASLGFALFGGAIGSFFTHAFHIRANQLKGLPAPLVPVIQATAAAAGDAAQAEVDAEAGSEGGAAAVPGMPQAGQ